MKNRLCWLAALPLAFTACQNQDMLPEEPQAGKAGAIVATIGEQAQTRAQVQYGNPDETKGELFMWNESDWLDLYDLQDDATVDSSYGYLISNSYDENTPSNSATFDPRGSYPYTNGHNMIAFKGRCTSKSISNSILTLNYLYVDDANTQKSSDTPGHADVSHLKDYLPMYAIATVSNGAIPSLSFRHLSSMFRYSLTNKTSSDVKIKKVTVTMTNKHFIMITDMTITETGEVAITDKGMEDSSLTLNFKDASNHPYTTIAKDATYDGYTIFMPDKNITFGVGETLSFTVTTTDGTTETTSNPITLDASRIATANNGTQFFEMGKRYWFDLTIDADGKLKWTNAATPPAEDNFIEIGNLKWATGNLVANGEHGAKIGAPTDYGLYFQFGSLVGWSGGANGDGTGTSTDGSIAVAKITPTDYTATGWDSKWVGDPTATDHTTGKGDPCRYYLGSTWRLPTATEYQALFNNTTTSWDGATGWSWNGTSRSATHTSGLLLPAAGGLGGGEQTGSGVAGAYWSSSLTGKDTGVFYMIFMEQVLNPRVPTAQTNGWSVRCVKD